MARDRVPEQGWSGGSWGGSGHCWAWKQSCPHPGMAAKGASRPFLPCLLLLRVLPARISLPAPPCPHSHHPAQTWGCSHRHQSDPGRQWAPAEPVTTLPSAGDEQRGPAPAPQTLLGVLLRPERGERVVQGCGHITPLRWPLWGPGQAACGERRKLGAAKSSVSPRRCPMALRHWPFLHPCLSPQESQSTSWHAREDDDVQLGKRVRTEPVEEGERSGGAATHQAVPAPGPGAATGVTLPRPASRQPPASCCPPPPPGWPQASPSPGAWRDAVLAPAGESQEGGQGTGPAHEAPWQRPAAVAGNGGTPAGSPSTGSSDTQGRGPWPS